MLGGGEQVWEREGRRWREAADPRGGCIRAALTQAESETLGPAGQPHIALSQIKSGKFRFAFQSCLELDLGEEDGWVLPEDPQLSFLCASPLPCIHGCNHIVH